MKGRLCNKSDNQLFMVLSLTDACKDRNVQTKEGPIVEII